MSGTKRRRRGRRLPHGIAFLLADTGWPGHGAWSLYHRLSTGPTGLAGLALLLTALDAAGNQMRLDECRTWTITGKRGYVATWGDGARWFIYCAPGSARKWDNIRRALSPLGKCTQAGDDEGIIRIDALPTPEQAVLIRKAIGGASGQPSTQRS